jgi:membrane glycosyltransferase
MDTTRHDIKSELKLKRKTKASLSSKTHVHNTHSNEDEDAKLRVDHKEKTKRTSLARRIMLATNIALSIFVMTMAARLILLGSPKMNEALIISLVIAIVAFCWKVALKDKSDIAELL